MRNFMYLSIGVLCLALAFHFVADTSRAGHVDHMGTGAISMSTNGSDVFVLDENGVEWKLLNGTGWTTNVDILPFPVAASEIKLWNIDAIVTHADEAWVITAGGVWSYVGQWPGATAPATATSWGKIKAEYRD